MAYYNVMMDRAIDEMWLQLGIGPTYMKERHGSTFTAECHVRYLREIHSRRSRSDFGLSVRS
jgi:acyl-CoA thioester hydrolase